jgi:hypothetical protein
MLVLDTERTVAGDDANVSTSQEALGNKRQPATEA